MKIVEVSDIAENPPAAYVGGRSNDNPNLLLYHKCFQMSSEKQKKIAQKSSLTFVHFIQFNYEGNSKQFYISFHPTKN